MGWRGLLKDQVQVLYRLVRFSGILLADRFSIAGWNFQLRRDFNDCVLEDVGAFLCRMQFVVLDTHQDDAMFWKASKDGEYSVNSFYRLLQENSAENVAFWPWKMTWKTLSLLKVACFGW